ncbi:PEBP-like protein [Crucibulum laeve]|uniref:PEBP-like protein n=1 Tax=Crucibulum laeve TaxID=68775 RepID=A0A5C3M451_9AGAR|nr:PEBP-like protein [Crucibulum laeve]
MRWSSIFWSVALFTLVVAQDTSLQAVKKAFDDAHIPGNLAITFNPKVLLEVTFPEPGKLPITLHAGVHLPRNSTAGPPAFSVIGTKSKGPFVVAAVDPDAPTPQTPTSAQIRHFLGGNFSARQIWRASTPLLTNSTPAVTEFHQPTPPAGSDAHRYVFLIFEQPAGFNAQTFVAPTTSISLFNISQFASEVGLGAPIGGTFMLVAPDPPAA